jgi:predicted kinase
MRPILFYTVGFPGAGKTTFAAALTTWLDGVHLRGDKIGLELFRFPTFSPQEKTLVYQEMARRSGDGLREGRHVLYDASVNTRAQRAYLHDLAARHGAPAIGLFLAVPTELAKKRAAKARDGGIGQPVARVIPPHIFDQIIAGFEVPHHTEPVLTIPGDTPFFVQYKRLRTHLGRNGIASLPRIVSF